MSETESNAGRRFDELVAIMAKLRAPGGCPWDRRCDQISVADLPAHLRRTSVHRFTQRRTSDARHQPGSVEKELMLRAYASSTGTTPMRPGISISAAKALLYQLEKHGIQKDQTDTAD
jgi:hypothetical protein